MEAIKLKDQIGNDIFLEKPAERIVSLVPSQTELLYDLGLNKQVVGITKFCIHPSGWRKEKLIVGGTKNHQLDKIHRLQPDLIIANKEENTKQLIEKLQAQYSVYVSDISDLNDTFRMMSDIGVLTGAFEKSKSIIESIQLGFEGLKKVKPSEPSIKVAYCIWRDPWMWAGRDTFINYLLDLCHFKNVVKMNRYPEIDWAEIKESSPDYIFLSSEPYPFKQKHIEELKSILPNTSIILVDGEYFSWYGSRLIKAPLYFISLLNQIHSNTL